MFANLIDVEVELRDMVCLLKEVDWHELGIQLKVPRHILRNINEENPHNVPRKLSQMLEYWKENNEEASWRKIVEAVQRIGGHGNIITEIVSQYMTHDTSSSAAILDGANQLPSFHNQSQSAAANRLTVETKANIRYTLMV